MRRRIGELWLALGCLHFMVVLALGWPTVSDILRDGYVNALGDDPERNSVFWLFYLGVPLVLLGMVIRWTQRRVGYLPEALGWVSLASFTLGALAAPASGFLLGVLLAIYMIVASRQESRKYPRRPIPDIEAP